MIRHHSDNPPALPAGRRPRIYTSARRPRIFVRAVQIGGAPLWRTGNPPGCQRPVQPLPYSGRELRGATFS